MFTDQEKQYLVDAMLQQVKAIERSKAKARNPRFGPIYDEDLRILAALVMKVRSLEVKNEGKVASRS